MCSHKNRLTEAYLMSTYNILVSILKKSSESIPNTFKSAAIGFFVRDSRTYSQ